MTTSNSLPWLFMRFWLGLAEQILLAASFRSDGRGLPSQFGFVFAALFLVGMAAVVLRSASGITPEVENRLFVLGMSACAYLVATGGFWLITSPKGLTLLSFFICAQAGVDLFIALCTFLGVETGITGFVWGIAATVVGSVKIAVDGKGKGREDRKDDGGNRE